MAEGTTEKKKPAVSPLLIVLLVVLVLGVGALLVDMAARNGAQGAYDAISEKIASEEDLAAGGEPESLTPPPPTPARNLSRPSPGAAR